MTCLVPARTGPIRFLPTDTLEKSVKGPRCNSKLPDCWLSTVPRCRTIHLKAGIVFFLHQPPQTVEDMLFDTKNMVGKNGLCAT